MRRILILLTILLISCDAQSQVSNQPNTQQENYRSEIHCKHFLFGYPYGAGKTNDLIIREIYAMSNDDSTKFADWVCWRMTKYNIGDIETNRYWRDDPWLEDSETLEPDDYKGAHATLGTDRGHLAPLASFDGTPHWEETNYLSNITPQKSDLNQGPWRFLEEAERKLLEEFDVVYVMTGTLYERVMPPLPQADELHQVPSGYWRIIATIVSESELRVAAYIMDQDTQRSAQFNDFLVTVDEVEMRSGLDFFWELEDDLEELLESQYDENWILMHLN